MIKTINQIKDELLENDYQLSSQTVKDLAWHLENDKDPHMAIILATDAQLKNLGPVIARHLDHEDGFIRERTIGCVLGRLELAEYAEKAFEMAQNDSKNVRNIAIFNLGEVMNAVPFTLAHNIATYLICVLQHDESEVIRGSAYFSILKAMNVPREKRPRVSRGVKPEDIDPSILEAFCKKYQVDMPTD